MIEALPSYQVPGPVHRSQVGRLHKLAALLIGDGLLPNAIKASDDFLVSVIEGERKRLNTDGTLQAHIANIKTAIVESMEIRGDSPAVIATEEFSTDIADINRLFAGARRKFRDGLAERYWSRRVTVSKDDPFDAKVLTIALSYDLATVGKVETEASDRVRQWLDTHGDAIAQLSEDKKAKYAQVRAMARMPELVHPGLPTGPISMSGDPEIPALAKHLYSDSNGRYRIKLGSWEEHVYAVESARPDFKAWYRNPTGGQRALRIPFATGTGFGKLYPDFVVIQQDEEGELRASIIDPHGHHLNDAGNKLRGLAAYAVNHGDAYGRILGVIRNSDGDFRFLDLKDSTVQATIANVNTKDEIEKAFADFGSVYA